MTSTTLQLQCWCSGFCVCNLALTDDDDNRVQISVGGGLGNESNSTQQITNTFRRTSPTFYRKISRHFTFFAIHHHNTQNMLS